MKLLLWIFQLAFQCHHNQLSRVLTIKKRTYQVCLECGQEFGYSWELMHSTRSSVADNAHEPLNSATHAGVPVI
jgi:hypothetical protein